MELKDFVEGTLVQIIEGVVAAQSRTKSLHAVVNPAFNLAPPDAAKLGLVFSGGSHAQMVQFDVALTVSQGEGTKGGIGIFIGAVTLGSGGESKAETASVSRVKFVVPVVLPGAHHAATMPSK